LAIGTRDNLHGRGVAVDFHLDIGAREAEFSKDLVDLSLYCLG